MGKWVHRLTDANEQDRSGNCANCGPVSITWKKRWRCKNAVDEQRGETPSQVRRLFKIDRPTLLSMLDGQDWQCAICSAELNESCAVDHNHSTVKVRGLLCMRCNVGIGFFRDDPNLLHNAIIYLEKQRAAP
jgi:hypothetical protein